MLVAVSAPYLTRGDRSRHAAAIEISCGSGDGAAWATPQDRRW
jgi:hypothetical protein